MKLLLPVGAIMFGAGFCCCGGDALEGFKQGAEQAMEEAAQDAGAPTGMAVEEAPAPADAAAPAAAGATLDGACGRFKTMGVTAPDGSKVTICTTDATSDTLIYNTEVGTEAACKLVKGWVGAQGFTIVTEGTFAGTSSIVAEKGSDQLVVACMQVMGKNSVTMTLNTR